MKKLNNLLLLVIFLFQFSANSQDYSINFQKDSIRILYVGYDNLVTVPTGSSLTAKEAKSKVIVVSKLNDITYKVTIASNKLKSANLILNIKTKTSTKVFKVEDLPKPAILLGTINCFTKKPVTKKSLMANVKNNFKLGYTTNSKLTSKVVFKKFHLKISVAGLSVFEQDVAGDKFPASAIKIFEVQKKLTIECTKFQGDGPAGKIRSEGFTIEIVE